MIDRGYRDNFAKMSYLVEIIPKDHYNSPFASNATQPWL